MRLYLSLLFSLLTLPFYAQQNENLVIAQINAGDNYFSAKDYEKAAQSYQGVLNQIILDFKTQNLSAQPNFKQLELCSQKIILLDVLEKKAEALIGLNDKIIALYTITTADQLIDIMRKDHTEKGLKAFWETKTHSLYEKALNLTFASNNTKKAFYFFEKNKAILLLDKMNEKGDRLLPDSLSQREKELLQACETTRNTASKDKTKHFDYLQANKDFDNFQKDLANSHPSYYHLRYDVSVPTLEENGAVYAYKNARQYVHFFCSKEYIYAMRFGAGKTEMNRTQNILKNNTLVEKHLQQLTRQKEPFDTSATYSDLPFQIYESLLRPLFPDSQLPADLVLLPEGLLQLIPFKELNNKANSANNLDAFLQQTNIRHAYSIKTLKEEQYSKNQKSNSLKDSQPSSDTTKKIEEELERVTTPKNKWGMLMYGGIGLLFLLLLVLVKRRRTGI